MAANRIVGADAYIGPFSSTNLPQISVKTRHSARADVGIGPYRRIYDKSLKGGSKEPPQMELLTV